MTIPIRLHTGTLLKWVLLPLLWFSGFTARAQEERFEQIRALKISFLTEQMALTPAQAENFWPVYHQYENEVRNIRKEFAAQYRARNKTATREQAREYINANLEYQQQILDLKKTYQPRLLKTISPEQLARLYDAEREFRKSLVRQLGNPPGDKK